ncbi:MAG: hypothetical protein CMM60_06765 [Rhodospirillaceae bacterium]|jgi:SAM-dependent methyltransferase|nr:hypothetical protein [Rhodospirillaceae bacterium]MDP6425774.1 class I SAM-dependent methyltransferase [Dehalococcoidia bacterium]|tara:strand:+ start:1441 stop:2106 length:666 start_codon:yes stop_codon:yes gene_type:complete
MDYQQFWEKKIIQWELDRYGEITNSTSIERIANRVSISLRFRIEYAEILLKPYLRGMKIIELGCGSGRLAEKLIDNGAKSYIGIDFATNAVEKANSRIERKGLNKKVRFVSSDVIQLSEFDGDIVFSLGLFDWLTPQQIGQIFKSTGSTHHMHSFSEKRVSVSQWIHRVYVHLSYGRHNNGYVPQYYRANYITCIAKKHLNFPLKIIRDRRLSFGAFVTTL